MKEIHDLKLELLIFRWNQSITEKNSKRMNY